MIIDDWLMVHGKVWIPIIDSQNNRDILKYCGIFQHGIVVTTPNKKFSFALTLVKRASWKPNYNTIFEFSWLFHKKSNQYFFVQYYNGCGESLLDYNVFHSRLRAGIVIKPKFSPNSETMSLSAIIPVSMAFAAASATAAIVLPAVRRIAKGIPRQCRR